MALVMLILEQCLRANIFQSKAMQPVFNMEIFTHYSSLDKLGYYCPSQMSVNCSS